MLEFRNTFQVIHFNFATKTNRINELINKADMVHGGNFGNFVVCMPGHTVVNDGD